MCQTTIVGLSKHKQDETEKKAKKKNEQKVKKKRNHEI